MAEAQFWIGVHGVIVEDARLLVLRRAQRMVYKPGAWDLPGGHLALEETLEHCLRRANGGGAGVGGESVRVGGVRKGSARPYLQGVYACTPGRWTGGWAGGWGGPARGGAARGGAPGGGLAFLGGAWGGRPS